MSKPREQQVTCPKCGKSFNITIWETINTDLYAHVPKNIIDGTLFKVRCPKCKYETSLEYDILYHDMKHKAMIWVIHPSNDNYTKFVEDVRNTNLLHYSYTRIVSDMNELKEKVSALEAGRDDRLVELSKVFFKYNLLKERPDYEFRNAFYSYVDGKEIVFLYDQKGDHFHSFLDEDIYSWVEEMFASKIADLPVEDYQIFNFDDAEKMFLEVAKEVSEDKAVDDKNKETSSNSVKVKVKVSPKKRIQSHHTVTERKICFCHKCGNKLADDALFCSKCGTKIPNIK